MSEELTPRSGPPPLAPFGLVLLRDGSWLHEGQPIRNRRLREHFDRSVRYLREEGKFVVTLGHFRGEIEVEEAPFFVRSVNFETGTVALSDQSEELLDVSSLSLSPHGGALLCLVKRDLLPAGVLARFQHAAQAEFLDAVVEEEGAMQIVLGGVAHPLPSLG